MEGTRQVTTAAVLAGALCVSAVLTGCGTSIEDLCEEYCDCEGCSDAELDECIEEGQHMEEMAEDVGCGDEWDDYVDCISDHATCDNGDWEVEDESCEEEFESCEDPYRDPM